MSEWVSDYTPSIQDMRETYEETHFYAPHTNSVKEKNAEFDRFLELVYQVERERIIKLLEELEAVGSNPLTGLYLNTTSLIAVIKGENK